MSAFEKCKSRYSYEYPLPDGKEIPLVKDAYLKLPPEVLDFQQPKMLEFMKQLLPFNAEYTGHPYNGMFYRREAAIWYSMLRYFKPKKIVEVGAGFSTNVAW